MVGAADEQCHHHPLANREESWQQLVVIAANPEEGAGQSDNYIRLL
jgi:hypothetical protein